MYSYPPKKTNDHFNIVKQTNKYLFDKTTPKPCWKLTNDMTRCLFFKPSLFFLLHIPVMALDIKLPTQSKTHSSLGYNDLSLLWPD